MFDRAELILILNQQNVSFLCVMEPWSVSLFVLMLLDEILTNVLAFDVFRLVNSGAAGEKLPPVSIVAHLQCSQLSLSWSKVLKAVPWVLRLLRSPTVLL